MKKIEKRVTAWKKVFTQGQKGVDENSSWREILLACNFDTRQTRDILDEVANKCGDFTKEEYGELYNLPHFKRIIRCLESLRNRDFLTFAKFDMQDDDVAYALRYPKWGEAQSNVTLIEVTIVTKTPVEFDTDIYYFFSDFWEAKNVVVRYATEIPQDWLEAKAEWDAKFKS